MTNLGGFEPVDYATSYHQTLTGEELPPRPFFRIALPVWRMPKVRRQEPEDPKGVTRDEIASIFGSDLVAQRASQLRLTENERRQLATNEKLRNALYSN